MQDNEWMRSDAEDKAYLFTKPCVNKHPIISVLDVVVLRGFLIHCLFSHQTSFDLCRGILDQHRLMIAGQFRP